MLALYDIVYYTRRLRLVSTLKRQVTALLIKIHGSHCTLYQIRELENGCLQSNAMSYAALKFRRRTSWDQSSAALNRHRSTTFTQSHQPPTMASPILSSLRAAQTGVCRQCATRRTFSLLTQTAKHEIRSRPTTGDAITFAKSSRTFTSSAKRSRKSIEEAKTQYKLGVRSISSWSTCRHKTTTANNPFHSPSHGKQAFSSSSPAPA
jgi:hypothetical protein